MLAMRPPLKRKQRLQKIQILLLTHRAHTGLAPGYIEQCVTQRQPVNSLRFSEHSVLLSMLTHTTCFLWNALPQHVAI